MKKTLLALVAALFTAITLTSCGKSDNNAIVTAADLGAGFTLKVGFDAAFPPYGFKNDKGELVGFDLDLAKEVATRKGWKLVLKPIDWDAKDAELDAGTINCIWNGFTINGREDKYTWSEAYVDNSQVVLVKRSSGINTLKDLAGKVVEAQADSSGLAAIKDDSCKELRASLKKLVEVPNFNQAFMELQSGACQAVIIDSGVAMTQIQGQEKEFKILEQTLKSEQYGVGFKLGNTALRDAVQATLKEMVKDGKFAEISKKWFNGKDVCVLKP